MRIFCSADQPFVALDGLLGALSGSGGGGFLH
jgi:hypothetical protein